jgi:hypothetical protein
MQIPVEFRHLKPVISHVILSFLSQSQYRSELFELEQHVPLRSHACNRRIQEWAGLDKCNGLCIEFQVPQLWPKNTLIIDSLRSDSGSKLPLPHDAPSHSHTRCQDVETALPCLPHSQTPATYGAHADDRHLRNNLSLDPNGFSSLWPTRQTSQWYVKPCLQCGRA